MALVTSGGERTRISGGGCGRGREHADRILAESVVNMPGSEVGFSRDFDNFRYFRCRKCEHAQLGCLTQAVCGRFASTGHQAESCTSLVTKNAACYGPQPRDGSRPRQVPQGTSTVAILALVVSISTDADQHILAQVP